jgi:glycosyltransferase involved in cell wall biosynthesis
MNKPIRVLHVLSALGQGGIEKWLVNLTAELKRRHQAEVDLEFLTFLRPGGYYQDTLEAMGYRVQHCQLAWRHFHVFLVRLAKLLREGRFDVVHCHADYLSGLILPVARMVGVRVRICHVHSTQFGFQARQPLFRYILGLFLRRMVVWDSGMCVGTSSAAIEAFLHHLKGRISCQVSVCGIACDDYRNAIDKLPRLGNQSLNWMERYKVVLHVGRHSESKNLFYLLEVFEKILNREQDVICMLAGSGPLTKDLKDRARELGISDSVHFLGSRDDVAELMCRANLLILPSLYEGLGLVVIEAQAVGLCSLVADNLPPEVEVVQGLVHRLPCECHPEVWAKRALELLESPLEDRHSALERVESSPFSITNSAQAMVDIYSLEIQSNANREGPAN